MRSEDLRESEGKLGGGETAAKGSQDTDKRERFNEYLVMSGRKGVKSNKSVTSETADHKKDKRLLKNLEGRERRRDQKNFKRPRPQSREQKSLGGKHKKAQEEMSEEHMGRDVRLKEVITRWWLLN